VLATSQRARAAPVHRAEAARVRGVTVRLRLDAGSCGGN